MPSDRTTVTELGTALGMLGLSDVGEAVRSRTPVMCSVSPEMWDHLARLWAGSAYLAEFHAAWANGKAFLAADEGLRGRLPRLVEWKGTGRAPGDDVAPIDLRVDHVYLVSCKYLSKILFNTSPTQVFDSLLGGGLLGGGLLGGGQPRGADWFAEVAPSEHQALYRAVRNAALAGADPGASPGEERTRVRPGAPALRGATALPGLGELTPDASPDGPTGAVGSSPGHPRSNPRGPGQAPALVLSLPEQAADMSSAQRDALGRWLRPGWPAQAKEDYRALCRAVARASARRWAESIDEGTRATEALLWRLLRIGNAPYFVLGSSAARSLRLRIATSWDWRQQFRLVSFGVAPQEGGQPRVAWEAVVRAPSTGEQHVVAGHIEVRWSHGRFAGPPEAKGYLDTPHHLVPGYVPLQ